MKNHRLIYLGLFLAFIIVLSGCNSVGPNMGYNNYNKKYYQGYDSLEMEFLEDSPPLIFYYDSEDPFNNEIPIIVQVKNKGASDTWGTMHIHGYDRSIIDVAGSTEVGGSYFDFNSGSMTVTIGGVYIGLRGMGFSVPPFYSPGPNSIQYGSSVFTQGQVRGLSFGFTQNRIGSRFALSIFNGYNNPANFFSFGGYNAPIVLEGDTPLTPGGGIEVYEFPALVYNLPPSIDQFRQPIMVTACFDYVTHTTAMICIDPQPHSNMKKACYARTVSLSGGQGAPVAITRVEQQASSSKTVFTIYVHHNRKNSLDDLYDYFSLGKCDPESAAVVKPTDKNVVYIGYIALSGIPLDCTPDYKIRLDNSGNGQIACTAYYPMNSMSAYEAPLEIELWYGYSKNIYKEITIKRI